MHLRHRPQFTHIEPSQTTSTPTLTLDTKHRDREKPNGHCRSLTTCRNYRCAKREDDPTISYEMRQLVLQKFQIEALADHADCIAVDTFVNEKKTQWKHLNEGVVKTPSPSTPCWLRSSPARKITTHRPSEIQTRAMGSSRMWPSG